VQVKKWRRGHRIREKRFKVAVMLTSCAQLSEELGNAVQARQLRDPRAVTVARHGNVTGCLS
jgi:hypothetical protein